MAVMKRFFISAGVAALAFIAISAANAGNAHDERDPIHAAGASIPPSLKVEHTELHEDLARLVKAGGRTGQAAMEVEKRLAPHFVKEEQMAMPQLGLLQVLAAGEKPADPEAAIRMSEQLESEMPQMLAEHQQIVGALDKLRAAGKAEAKPEAMRFADTLSAHAQTEEQILYPAAILVGKYLKLQRR